MIRTRTCQSQDPCKPSSLYVHIPFCKKKCLYCDFFSGGQKSADWQRLTNAILSEAAIRKEELTSTPDTLYIGGGTPSLMPLSMFDCLVTGLYEVFSLRYPQEFTIEVNPEDVTETSANLWKTKGVNRISMGVQSFDDGELKSVGRRHNSAQIFKAFDILRPKFDNISVDLIFGLPGQSTESWNKSLNRVFEMNPEHVSCYTLMLEEKTPLTVLHERGLVDLPTEEEVVSMWNLLSRRMKEMGYLQYEISNFCKPGKHSIHNYRYWTRNPYLGLGPSAHSFDGVSVRRCNPPVLKSYLDHFDPSSPPRSNESLRFGEEEHLSQEEIIEETVMLSMRTAKGIDLLSFRNEFGPQQTDRLLCNSRGSMDLGLIVQNEGFIRLTEKGIMVADNVIIELLK